MAKRLSETPATMAICLGPLLVEALPIMSGTNNECIWRGSLSSFSFQRSLVWPTVEGEKTCSSCCQLVRSRIDAIREPIGGGQRETTESRDEEHSNFSVQFKGSA